MRTIRDLPVLTRRFYAAPVQEVAPRLLGAILVHGRRSGRIVEVEAYGGSSDPGSHAARAPTGRARIMFGPPGVAYVYFTYGMHFCLNAVTGREGEPGAVLIRAAEPLSNVDAMRAMGGPDSLPDHKLASGPGRVCRAFGIGRSHNEANLVEGVLRIRRGDRVEDVRSGPRIGLSRDDGRPWRFYTPSASLSRPV